MRTDCIARTGATLYADLFSAAIVRWYCQAIQAAPDGILVSCGAARKLRAGVVVASAAAAADGGEGSAKEAFTKDFYRTRLLTFAAMFVGYGSYYLTRNSLSYVVPTLLEDKVVGLTMTQIGGLTSVLPVCYGTRFSCPHPPAPPDRPFEHVLHCCLLAWTPDQVQLHQ